MYYKQYHLRSFGRLTKKVHRRQKFRAIENIFNKNVIDVRNDRLTEHDITKFDWSK